jgi:hypothetical protein
MNAYLAALCADELADRRAAARRVVEAGSARPERAEAELRPFAALACRWGLDVPELSAEIAQLQHAAFHGDARAARVHVADELCSPAGIRAALIKARDRALDRAEMDPSRLPRATRLATLAAAFGCALVDPVQSERKAA